MVLLFSHLECRWLFVAAQRPSVRVRYFCTLAKLVMGVEARPRKTENVLYESRASPANSQPPELSGAPEKDRPMGCKRRPDSSWKVPLIGIQPERVLLHPCQFRSSPTIAVQVQKVLLFLGVNFGQGLLASPPDAICRCYFGVLRLHESTPSGVKLRMTP
jgi:hypothetical protein